MSIEDKVAKLPVLFKDFLDMRGLVYDPATQVDMLACALGSQFLLFAGPSGTGKSTAAKALAEFFTPQRQGVIEARPAWTSTEDVVGQYSVYTGTYVAGPHTDEIAGLNGVKSPPTVIVEEANLSPMEAYLGPVITTASKVAFRELCWAMHQQESITSPPTVVVLGAWPRFYGTVNVDSTAEAPAPKVSGRACVVLLEPPDVDTALLSTAALHAPANLPPGPKEAAEVFGDPLNAWNTQLTGHAQQDLTDALQPVLKALRDSAGRGLNVVSPRDVQRCVAYMAWHAALANAAVTGGLLESTSLAESAENAVLHFILPGLSSEQFGRVLGALEAVVTDRGLLSRRVARLLAGGESLFGVAPDFWASLS